MQEYRAGEFCESDFTHLNDLEITIADQPFAHMLYHFVLTYSNWETGTICYTESFASESLSYERYLHELIQRECEERQENVTAKILRESHLPLQRSLAAFRHEASSGQGQRDRRVRCSTEASWSGPKMHYAPSFKDTRAVRLTAAGRIRRTY